MKRTPLLLTLIIFLFIRASSSGQDAIDTSVYVKDNPNIYALMIAKDNRLIKSSYYNHYSGNSLFNEQSLTKSICSLLIGIAIDRHYIRSVDEKLVTFFPELANDPDKRKQQITLRQVMNQASGLYHEDLTRLDLYLDDPGPSDLVLRSPLTAEPGKEWHYNNAASHLLSVILTKATHMDTRSFAVKYLFAPMGITHVKWTRMRDGFYDGSGLLSIHLRTRDMVSIGNMILNRGHFRTHQIVSPKWINSILRPDIVYAADWGFKSSTYALCWYHTSFKGASITYAMGWGGQFLILVPSLHSVVVINENIADANAVRQSITFTTQIFPLIFDLISH